MMEFIRWFLEIMGNKLEFLLSISVYFLILCVAFSCFLRLLRTNRNVNETDNKSSDTKVKLRK